MNRTVLKGTLRRVSKRCFGWGEPLMIRALSLLIATQCGLACAKTGEDGAVRQSADEAEQSSPVAKPEIFIAGGAGYRRPLDTLKAMYEKDHSAIVNCIYGNMKQVTAQVKNSKKVSLVVGDAKFLDKSGIPFVKRAGIGKGRLVLAFDKSLAIARIEDLERDDIERVILPDAKKAIYGKAAHEVLERRALYTRLERKLIVVQTVPQVTAYLMSGTAKVGFLNRTDFLSLDPARFAALEVDQTDYSPIAIEAALTREATDEGTRFFAYLGGDAARRVFSTYGLGPK